MSRIIKRSLAKIKKEREKAQFPDYEGDLRKWRGKIPHEGWREGEDPDYEGEEYPNK